MYAAAVERARASGCSSVDLYLTKLVEHDVTDQDYDHVFTPEVLASLNRASEQARAGPSVYDG